MTTEYFAVIVNTPTDEDGLFRQYVKIIEKYGYHGVKDGIVLWDERSMGNIRLYNPISQEFFLLSSEFAYALEGVSTRVYGGINNSIPYINEGVDWLEGHKLWMLQNYKLSIDLWSVKAFLHEIPDGGSNKLVTMNTIIEATYATTPLNKVRWEEREFMNWGDPLYLLIQEELGVTHFSLRHDFEWMIPESYNEYNEATL